MKNITVLGVDPGIAHTGVAVIKVKTVGYSLITAETLKTSARDETGKRLSIMHDEINATFDAWHIDAIAIARVFHGRNTSSSLTTGAVIGLVHLIAYQRGVPKTDLENRKPSIWDTAKITYRKPSIWDTAKITYRSRRFALRPHRMFAGANDGHRADETGNRGQQHINELLQIQALFDAWGVRLARCNRLGGYFVKGHGDDAFFLTEQTIESVIALRKAKVANLQIKAILEEAGVDFSVLTQPAEPPVTMQTQLHQIVHEVVESTFQ